MSKFWTILFSLMLAFTLAGCNEDKEAEAAAENGTEAVPEPELEICADCGTVSSITPVTVKGEGSGAGAAIGAVVGGVLGHQVGGGSGKDVATVVGAVGGALAGNEIEKRRKAQTYFEVLVDMEAGGQQTVTLGSAEGIGVGTPVRVVGNDLHLL